MYFEITKGELKDFLNSYTSKDKFYELQYKNKELYDSLVELSEILYRYWLFDKSKNYIIKEGWQFDDIMYMSKSGQLEIQSRRDGRKYCDLIDYFKSHIRNTKIEVLLEK